MKKILYSIIGCLTIGQVGVAQNQLFIPSTISGTTVNLELQNGTHQFYSGTNTQTMGINGNILGPTLILNQGDFVDFAVTNSIADTTTIHWHGLHVSPENDGGPHTVIAPGATWTPSFTILDKAATYWYHPHLHHKTNKHVSKGMAGFIIVKDSEEAALNLPRTYGVDDFPFVLQTKDFDVNKEIVVPSNADDVVMVNATIDGILDVPAQMVRLRLLNGSSMRVFNVGLEGDKPFNQIASDGGLLSVPNTLTRIQLAPGERAEIIVDFSTMNGQTVTLKSFASEFPNGIYGATSAGMNANMPYDNYSPNPLNGSDYVLMTFNVVTQNANPITTIPSTLANVTPIAESAANITRELVMQPKQGGFNQLNGSFTFDGASFDMAVVNYQIPLNNTEIWSIRNQSAIAHPFHIHDVQFYVLDRSGNAPPASEQGRKDVILIKPQETVRFIAKFDDFSSTVPYMYHCHMLFHEDGGMMGQFTVDSSLEISDLSKAYNIDLYPNPTNGQFTIDFNKQTKVKSIVFYNLVGKQIGEINNVGISTAHTVNIIEKGVYLIQINTEENSITKRIIIQ